MFGMKFINILSLLLLFCCQFCDSFRLQVDRSIVKPHVVSRSKATDRKDVGLQMGPTHELSVQSAPPLQGKLWKTYLKTTETLTTLFPLWTVLFAGLALVRPQSFAWFTTKYFTAFLGKEYSVLLILDKMECHLSVCLFFPLAFKS